MAYQISRINFLPNYKMSSTMAHYQAEPGPDRIHRPFFPFEFYQIFLNLLIYHLIFCHYSDYYLVMEPMTFYIIIISLI
jgi:hypothetical protein